MKKFAVAHIRESECIGCTKCIEACPVDAIIGARKLMHTVLAEECIGCKLCVEPCPVDCIEMIAIEKPLYDKEKVKQRVKNRAKRLAKKQQEQKYLLQEKKSVKQTYIQDILQRVKAKKDRL